MSTAPDPLVGRLIDDRYEAQERIARGGMATVYRGMDRRLEREVAIKVMHPHLAESEDFIARFRREARSAARLSHPHVVGVFDQGLWNDSFYLVMEFIDGEDLRARLRREGTMSLRAALDVTEDVLDALGAAHRRDLVHRDIKPENVMISREGEVKVADFGLVRARSEATSSHSGTIFGTVEYIAPELAAHAHATPGADVYAAGIMLYEMLTGEVPFSAEMPINVVLQHVNTDVPRPSEKVPWIPTEVDELVSALTARDPEERLSDGDAGVAAVRRIRQLIDPHLLDRRQKPTARAAAPDDSATAAINARLPGGTVALPAGAIATVQDEAERVKPRHTKRNLLLTLLFLLLAAGGGTAWYFLAGPGAYTALPSVVGLSVDRATTILEDAGFDVVVDRQNDDFIPLDEVIRTDPSPQAEVRKGADITVVVSDGILMLELPEVVGLPQEEALTALEGFGEPVLTEVWDEDAPVGEVLALAAADGTTLEVGTAYAHNTPLALTVSKGPEPITVPELAGLSEADAEQALADLGLTAEYGDAVYSETVPAGAVVSQSPTVADGATLHRGDTVTLVLSLGPPLVDVPYVIGKSQDEAVTLLENAGFDVDVKYLLGGFLGIVRYQDPGDVDAPQAPKGSTITITVV